LLRDLDRLRRLARKRIAAGTGDERLAGGSQTVGEDAPPLRIEL